MTPTNRQVEYQGSILNEISNNKSQWLTPLSWSESVLLLQQDKTHGNIVHCLALSMDSPAIEQD